jgi:hypothetical protein
LWYRKKSRLSLYLGRERGGVRVNKIEFQPLTSFEAGTDSFKFKVEIKEGACTVFIIL